MDKIEVTRPISDIERDILTTRTDATPVAWMYEREDGSKDLVLDCNGDYARRLIELGATETPLYTHPPATDVAAQDDTALLEKLADEACKRLGIDPNEIVDPVGPVRKKDDIIYAMYAFAREKFWDTEPNDVAALVEAARALVNALDSCVDLTPNVIRRVEQALAPFTKGQP